MTTNATTDKEVSTDDQSIDTIRKRLEDEVERIREAGGKPVIRATDEGGQVARFDARKPFDIQYDAEIEAPTLLGTAASGNAWSARTFMGADYPDGWHFSEAEVVDAAAGDRPDVQYHQGEDLAPVDRVAIPEDVRAVVDVYRDHARELGAREVEVRHFGDGVFTVVHRHGEPGGGGG